MVTLMAAYQGGINPRETGLTTAPFDTLKLARRLRDANFSTEQAEGAASAIAEALQTHLVTKRDLREMELRLGSRLGELGARVGGPNPRLEGREPRLDGELAAFGADLRADIIAAKVDIIKCWVGLLAVQTLVILGAMVTLVRS